MLRPRRNPPTVTDSKLITGVINPNYFAVGQFALDVTKAEAALKPIAERFALQSRRRRFQ